VTALTVFTIQSKAPVCDDELWKYLITTVHNHFTVGLTKLCDSVSHDGVVGASNDLAPEHLLWDGVLRDEQRISTYDSAKNHTEMIS